jgi:hypothetical protein
MRRTWCVPVAVLVILAGCGEDPIPKGGFEVVAHHPIGARGMNSALAVAGNTVYVGSRIDNQGIAILDVSDPANATLIGEIPGRNAMSSRELRAIDDLNLLVVLAIRCDPDLHGCSEQGGDIESIQLFDITNRAAPVQVGNFPITGSGLRPKGPHEFYLRRDGNRVLLFVASPPVVVDVLDVTDPAAPALVVSWNPMIRSQGLDDIMHSVSMNDDGSRLYLSHQLSGLLIADATALPEITLLTSSETALDFSPPGTVGPHSTVQVPGRDVVVVTEEVYPPPYGTGCPWGALRTVDVSDPAAPKLLATLGVAENDPLLCETGTFDRVTFTAHNATATRDLAFVTWHAAGLQVIDIADAARPRILGELRPEPLAAVTNEDPGLGGNPVEMWSYPVIRDGLIYVIDVRNGLYILRYHGLHEEQVRDEAFLEGNSNL